MQQLLQSYGTRIELILANNDDMALGALDAYRASNIPLPPIFGIDGTEPGLSAVRDQSLTGTVKNNGIGQAEAMLSLALSLAAGEKSAYTLDRGKYIRIPYEAVSADKDSSITARSTELSR